MASSSQNSEMSSHQLADEELMTKKTEKAIVSKVTYLLALNDALNKVDLISLSLMVDDPVKFDRLHALFTATQWRESPVKLAEVIDGESPICNEIPDVILTYLRAGNILKTDDIEQFKNYLAYRAERMELFKNGDLSSILPKVLPHQPVHPPEVPQPVHTPEIHQPVQKSYREIVDEAITNSDLFKGSSEGSRHASLVGRWLLTGKLSGPMRKLRRRINLKVKWYRDSVVLSIGKKSHTICYNDMKANLLQRFNIPS